MCGGAILQGKKRGAGVGQRREQPFVLKLFQNTLVEALN
jgi:hypothetical protein